MRCILLCLCILQGGCDYKSPTESFFQCDVNVTKVVTRGELNQLLVQDDELTIDAELSQPGGESSFIITVNQCSPSDDDTINPEVNIDAIGTATEVGV